MTSERGKTKDEDKVLFSFFDLSSKKSIRALYVFTQLFLTIKGLG